MIQINLLPIGQIKKRQRVYQQTIALLVSLLVVFALMGMTAINMSNKITGIKTEIENLNKEKATYVKTRNEIDKLKKDKLALENKLEAIKKLKQVSQEPVRILDALANLTPADTLWIKSLKQSPSQLNLTGIALDNATIAKYMNALTDSPYFSDAKLGNTRLTQMGGQKLKSFTLTITIAEIKPEEEPNSSPKNGQKN